MPELPEVETVARGLQREISRAKNLEYHAGENRLYR